MALDAMPRITPRESKTQLSLVQNPSAEAKSSKGEPAASKARNEAAEEKDAPRGLPKAADADGLNGKFAKLRGKHDAGAAKSIGAQENETPKAEVQPGFAHAVATNAKECGAGVVPPAAAPASPAVDSAGPAFVSASPAVALQKSQAAGPPVKQSGAPADERDRPAVVGAKHENSRMSAAIDIGAPGGHLKNEVSSSTNDGGPLHAAETATVALPSSPSSHPAAVPARAGTRLDGTKAVEAPQVLESGPARLDVGVSDGTHGWLRIRAELGTGGAVNASLTAGAAGHESLRAVLPEMASYLQSEAVSVNRIVLHRAAAGSNSMGPTDGQQNGGAPRQGAAGEQAQKDGGSVKRNQPVMEQHEAGSVISATRDTVDSLSAGGVHSMPGLGVGLGVPGGGRGGWLNVRA
jgi:hypothetical protein